MGSSNISSVGKFFAPAQVADKGKVADEDVRIAFGELMSQMTMGNYLSAGSQMPGGNAAPKMGQITALGSDYDKYQYRDSGIKEQPKADLRTDDKIAGKLEKFADDVREVLKEELGVTDAQIGEAMETLGLTFAELLHPNQLAALVAELTGAEDVSTMLFDGSFMAVMQEVGKCGEELLKELGISPEELARMIEEMRSAESTGTEVTEEKAPAQAVETVSADVQDVESTVGPEIVSDTAEESGKKAVVAEDNPEDLTAVEKDVEVALTTEETFSAKDGKNDQASGDSTFKNANSQTGHGEAMIFNQSIAETGYTPQTETAGGFGAQMDVADIIRQITEYSRVTITNRATTMEMQLNPQNLGKIFLEITSKDGIVSARITAQNELVKEALESQIVDLRQSLDQAGVKVEAVEVTVGSHEFERNLEQNAKQEERQAQEHEKASKQTRRLRLDDLAELGGIMTEEEALVAQMMAEQGNSVDFTA